MWQPQIILVVLCFNDGLIARFLQVLVFCFADWEPFCIGLLHYYLWQSLPDISVKQEPKIMGVKNFMSTQIRRWGVHTSLYLVCLGLSPAHTHVSFLLSSTSTGLGIHLVSFSEATIYRRLRPSGWIYWRLRPSGCHYFATVALTPQIKNWKVMFCGRSITQFLWCRYSFSGPYPRNTINSSFLKLALTTFWLQPLGMFNLYRSQLVLKKCSLLIYWYYFLTQ